MGNSKSTKSKKEPEKFFDRERWKETVREEKKRKEIDPSNKRSGIKEPPQLPTTSAPVTPPRPPSTPNHAPAQTNLGPYDDEALNRMRFQLQHDSDAFLLNNILLSVQFFENYEREIYFIKNNPISDRERHIEEAMVQHHKHVFFADRLQECVHEHVGYQRTRRAPLEPLCAPRLFVIYDNVEASEPGDTSDYSAVLDAPFYKLLVEDCKEPGYIKLKKIEVLKSTITKEVEPVLPATLETDDSIYTDSDEESLNSDDLNVSRGEALLHNLKEKIIKSRVDDKTVLFNNKQINNVIVQQNGRRYSGPIRSNNLSKAKEHIHNLKQNVNALPEETTIDENEKTEINTHLNEKPRKSILKANNRVNNNVSKKVTQNSISEISEDTETSGYNSSYKSETESDYGYSTITELTTPKKLELSVRSNYSSSSGVIPDECWTSIQVKAVDQWSDEDEEKELEDSGSASSFSRNLYETFYYLSSTYFMRNFVDNFMIKLGSGLGFTTDAVCNALTQGASVYCDSLRNGTKTSYEVFPALIAAWPNAANQWIIRERKIIQNPRTNFTYQWPTQYMVSKSIGFGCLLVPIGFRPKRGANPNQELQWRIIFPAAERYLESCLAHSHIRCYLFTLALHKCFLENESAKIGIDASHIKNHLFWECEDNYAKWPEDRLGETFRLFLKSFYSHFGKTRYPNFFIESSNDFKSLPKPLLYLLQRKLADILESPVMHILSALRKIKYTKKDFYPTFNVLKLYEILTCKNVLGILNPNLPVNAVNINNNQSSDSDDEHSHNFWNELKSHDKHYQWKKERQKQIQERRKNMSRNNNRQKAGKKSIEINNSIILPKRMDPERRRLVFEFFIPHFIAMARSSEKFDAIKQAIIYLEQAKRLCILLMEEPAGELTANEYLEIITDKLADCHRALVNQGRFKLPRTESRLEPTSKFQGIRKQRPRYNDMLGSNSPSDAPGISPFSFVEAQVEHHNPGSFKFLDGNNYEESKL